MDTLYNLRLFVSGIPIGCNEQQLRSHFETFGEVSSLCLLTSSAGKFKGTAEVNLVSADSTLAKSIPSQPHSVLGVQLQVREYLPSASDRISLLDEENERALHVGALRLEVSDLDLFDYFSRFGSVERAHVIKKEGISKSFGFVRFTEKSVAEKVLSLNHEISGSIITVAPKVSKNLRKPPKEAVSQMLLAAEKKEKTKAASMGFDKHLPVLIKNRRTGKQICEISPTSQNSLASTQRNLGFELQQVSYKDRIQSSYEKVDKGLTCDSHHRKVEAHINLNYLHNTPMMNHSCLRNNKSKFSLEDYYSPRIQDDCCGQFCSNEQQFSFGSRLVKNLPPADSEQNIKAELKESTKSHSDTKLLIPDLKPLLSSEQESSYIFDVSSDTLRTFLQSPKSPSEGGYYAGTDIVDPDLSPK